jgi:WD40 repeat protein/Flp pilus assembly protein TadD
VSLRSDGRLVIVDNASTVKIVDLSREDPISVDHIRAPNSTRTWSSDDAPLSSDGRWLAINHGDEISIWKLFKDDGASQRSENAKSEGGKGQLIERLLRLPLGLSVAQAGKPHKTIRAPKGESFSENRISHDGHWLVARAHRGWHAWNLLAAREASPIELGADLVAPTFSPDGRFLTAFVQQDNRRSLVTWDLADNLKKLSDLELQDQYFGDHNSLAYSADGRWLVASGRQLQLWKSNDEGALEELIELSHIRCEGVAISDDGQRIAAIEAQTVHISDRKAQRSHILRGHESPISAIALSPDGNWLATGSYDGDVRIWDVSSSQPQETMLILDVDLGRGRFSPRSKFVFGPDARWLAIDAGQTIVVCPLEPARLMDDARRLAGRELTVEEVERYRLNGIEVRRGALLRQAAEISQRLKKTPQDATLIAQHAQLLACAGQLDEAIDEMQVLIRLKPDEHWTQYQLLSLLAQTGRDEAYLRLCDSMAKQFAETDQLEIYERVAKGSLFWAESGANWRKVAPLADLALKKATEANHWVVPWAQIAKGFAEYRLDNYAAARNWAEKGLSHNSTAYSVVVPGNQLKAMALARLGHQDEARQALDEAKRVHAAALHPAQGWFDGWNDWYMYDILFREADAVLLAHASPEEIAADTPATRDESPPAPPDAAGTPSESEK